MDIPVEQEDEFRLIRALKVRSEPDQNFIEDLVRSFVNVNAIDKNGKSALHIVAQKNFLNSARILLKSGASVNIRGRLAMTPLHFCANNEHGTEMVRLLIKYGADVNAADVYKDTPLHNAVYWKCVGPMQELLQNGAKVNVMNVNFDTPLYFALFTDHLEWDSVNVEMAEALLKAGANINLRGEGEGTLLHWAVSDNLLHVVRFLLKKNARVNICDDQGRTPLHYVAWNPIQPAEIIRELFKKGAFLNALNLKGQSPLYSAVYMLNVKATQELLRCGASSQLEACMEALQNNPNVSEQNKSKITVIFKDLIRYTFLQSPNSF